MRRIDKIGFPTLFASALFWPFEEKIGLLTFSWILAILAAKPKALVAKKRGHQIILVVPKELKTSIDNSEDKIEAGNRLQQEATNPFAEDHSNPPSSPNHFHRWTSLQQLHWIWTAIAWSSRPQSFPVSLNSSPMRPCQFFGKYLCQYFLRLITD